MNLFDRLVDEALKNQPHAAPLRVVVEKELLHHDILRVLSHNNLLAELTFIGGTCLRSCYGGTRLSEDLDFTGGAQFTRTSLSTVAQLITDHIYQKYGFAVHVSEPVKDKLNVDTWKIRVETRPEQKHLPSQRINIDICSVPSYDVKPMLLLNPYGVEMGTGGLIIRAQSREEIYADKLLAFAYRPNRIKYRDLWDIVWLYGRVVTPALALIPLKLADRGYSVEHFLRAYNERATLLSHDEKLAAAFYDEIRRFLPVEQMRQLVEQKGYWVFLTNLIYELGKEMRRTLL
jgi:predicted nucleotidyltransferase component of viral defense system